MLQVKAMSSHQRRAGTTKWTSSSAPRTSSPSRTSSSSGSPQSGHSELDDAVRVQGGRDPERVPGAVGEPRAAAGLDPVRRLDGGERVQHPDLGRAGVEDERVGVVEAPVGGCDLVLGEPERRGGLGRCLRATFGDEGRVDVVPDPQVELVHRISGGSAGAR